jgi:predicted dienelactone hydrolase
MADKLKPIVGLVLGFCLCFAEPIQAAEKPTPNAYKAGEGPFTVGSVKDLVLTDAKRKKDLKISVYFPKGKGPFPVVIFSHGFGGTKDGYAYLSRFLAGHGYVSIHPNHADAGAPLQVRGGGGEDVRKQLTNPKVWEGRVGDVSFLIDSFPALERKLPALKGELDAARIGVAGHSFGAFTSMLIGGTTVDVPNGTKGKSFADTRVKAILPISPQGTSHMGLKKGSWDKLKLPMLVVTGTRDRGLGGEPASWREEPFRYSPAGDKYLLIIDGANHFSFVGGRFDAQEKTIPFVKVAAVAFWDAYLKGDREAKAYLQSDKLQAFGKGAVKFSKK